MPAGSKPGERRGGRAKGVKNRPTLEIEAKLRALNCDPIEGMVRIARDPKSSRELKGKMYSELASYIHPKRKAVEHTGPGGNEIQVIFRSVLDT